ncbi:hypothetical protein cypCar_00046000, partial [Cyprinus carpio]
ISVSCEDVTGSVGKEVNLTCSVILLINKCCIKNYMFEYKDSKICRQVLRESCERRKSVTCSYTPTTTVTEKFSFFVQASCGWKKLSFTVDTTVYLGLNKARSSPPETAAGLGFKDTAISVAVSGLIIFLIIIMTIMYKTKPNFTKLSEQDVTVCQT